MQNARRISLHALRAFVVAAERSSLKNAASELGVTPGAVSHQVRALEDAIGTQLFRRRNNAIDLTVAGEQLLLRSRPGLAMLEEALQSTLRDANEISLKVSTTLALRWLVPRLADFRTRHPKARIRFETLDQVGAPAMDDVDIAVAYHRQPVPPDGAEMLIEDTCRPYLSPDLLSRQGSRPEISAYPALQSTENNWDWERWLASTGQPDVTLNYTDRFDLDDVALRAAIAGMGMILAPGFLIRGELADGRLAALPESQSVTLGCYAIHRGRRETALSQAVVRWLKSLTRR